MPTQSLQFACYSMVSLPRLGLFIQKARFFHLSDHLLLSLPCQIRIDQRIVCAGRIGNPCQHGTFIKIHLNGLFSEISAARLCHTVIAIPKINGIQVQFQNRLFVIYFFNLKCHKHLRHFPAYLLILGKELIFCKLLRDRTAAFHIGSCQDVVVQCPADAMGSIPGCL